MTVPDSTPLLQARAVSKAFAGVTALEGVSLSLRAGEVHALIGENGAGKSTLINVLGGVFGADSGELRWRGGRVVFDSPVAAARRGIAVIHQEPQLIAAMTALDNLFVGEAFPNRRGTPLISLGAMRRRARDAQQSLGFELPLDALVTDLSATQRTRLALLRCLMREPELLILDEPTAALTSRDAQQLLALVGAMRQRGKAVLYVSHRLDEVLQIADRITVLRNGSSVCTVVARGQTHAGLVEAMSGPGGADDSAAVRVAPGGPALLEVLDLASVDGRVRSVGLTVHEGELLGVYGLAGSGRTEFLETLVGLRPRRAGLVRFAGQPCQPDGPRQAAELGLALIPEDRRGDALVLGMRLRENLTLPFLRRFSRAGWIDRVREQSQVRDLMRALNVRATGPDQIIAELSGGNQQKVVFARALAMAPRLLLCDEPTQAVDIGTRRAIHCLLRRQCDKRGAVLLVTSDLDEMLELADRIVVLRDGCSVTTLDNHGLTSSDVLRWCFASDSPSAPGVPAEVID